MLNRLKHELVMKKILMDIYSNTELGSSLAFKGGTCLYFFYNLNRFSTDLDFNFTGEQINNKKLNEIFSKYLEISEYREKHFTWFWQGSYEKSSPKIKVEISKRNYPNTYEFQNFYGLTVQTMSKDCMFAHKLCAITNRQELQNRDLFDSWFMFEQNFPINEEIVRVRTGLSIEEYFTFAAKYIEKNISKKSSILEGLGEVLDNKQKDWVKVNLLRRLLFELKVRSGK